uniref:SF4 helicase domain-containing protein n=1 Tax=Soboliphyme baturini TaxID=241478 RepID=A0A183IMZ8_9BILA
LTNWFFQERQYQLQTFKSVQKKPLIDYFLLRKSEIKKVRDCMVIPGKLSQAGINQWSDFEVLHYERDMPLDLLWNDSLKISELEEEDLEELQKFSHFKLVPLETMERFQVKVSKDLKSLIFPLYGGNKNEPTGAKVVTADADNSFTTATVQRDDGLFGYNLVEEAANVVAVFSSELDAMMCYCRTGYCSVSVPDELELKNSTVLPELKNFDTLYIWFPADEIERAKTIGHMIGVDKCYFVRDLDTYRLTLSELVQRRKKQYTNVEKILLNAVRMLHSSICSIQSESDVVANFIYKHGVLKGIAQWKRLSVLNDYLGGLRLGELTLLSGPTGCGKTTFLSQYSLDLCEQTEAQKEYLQNGVRFVLI